MPNLTKCSLGKSLRKVFLLSQIFGLAPLNLGSNGFCFSPLLFISSLCFAGFTTFWTIFNAFSSSFFISLPFVQLIVKIVRVIFVSYLASCIVTSLRSVKKINHVVDDLLCIDIFLSKFGNVVEEAISISLSVSGILFQVAVFTIQMLISKELHLDLGNIYLFFIFTHASESQYVGMLDIFLTRFRALLKCLKKLKSKNDRMDAAVILSNVHLLLTDSLSEIGRIYSPQLLFFTALSLARFILFLFSIVFLRSNTVRDIRILICFVFPFWLVIATWKFLRVIRMISVVTREVGNIN